MPPSVEGARHSNLQETFSHQAREETAGSTPSKGPTTPAPATQQIERDAKRSLKVEDIKKMIDEAIEQKAVGALATRTSKGYPLSAEIMKHPA